MRLVKDNLIDFEKYLQGPSEAPYVLPANRWVDEVVEIFHQGTEPKGAKLPWKTTHHCLRLRGGEVTIWSGINGHGKSLLLNQVVLMLLAQNALCCIASMEMKPVATMYRMARQALGSNNPIDETIREFHRWTDGRLWLYDQQNTVKSDRMLALSRYCHDEYSVTHVVIDSLMKCGIGVDDYNGQKKFIDQLCSHARDTGQHIHVVAHARKGSSEKNFIGKFDIKGTSEITDQVDNVFTIWRNKDKEEEMQKQCPDQDKRQEPDAILSCDKQRHGEWEGKVKLWFNQKSLQYTLRDDVSKSYQEIIQDMTETQSGS